MTYKTFVRTAKNWEEFATAQKTTVERGLSIEQAFSYFSLSSLSCILQGIQQQPHPATEGTGNQNGVHHRVNNYPGGLNNMGNVSIPVAELVANTIATDPNVPFPMLVVKSATEHRLVGTIQMKIPVVKTPGHVLDLDEGPQIIQVNFAPHHGVTTRLIARVTPVSFDPPESVPGLGDIHELEGVLTAKVEGLHDVPHLPDGEDNANI